MKYLLLISLFLLFIQFSFSQILIDEKFTNGKFDGIGKESGIWDMSSKVSFSAVNNRNFDTAALRFVNTTSGGWDATIHWYSDTNIQVDYYNEIVFLQFQSFSDVAGTNISPHYAVQVAMLEDKTGDDVPWYGHDLSFEVDQIFFCENNHMSMQTNPNVENTAPYYNNTTKFTNFDKTFFDSNTLSNSYDVLTVWRNKIDEGKTKIEIHGNYEYGGFDVNKAMVSEYDSIIPGKSVFNHVQIALFAKHTGDPCLYRSGYDWGNAQIGIKYIYLAKTNIADFNLDFQVDKKDADILIENIGIEGNKAVTQTGDANNDYKIDIFDAISLIGFWTDTSELKTIKDNVSASGSYNSATGEVILHFQNISYFHIEGKNLDNIVSANTPDFSAINHNITIFENKFIGAFTKDAWHVTNLNIGNVLHPGLDEKNLFLVFNYKGSKEREGIRIPLDGSVFVSNENFPNNTIQSNCSIYPNPVENVLFVECKNNTAVTIFNALGMVVYQGAQKSIDMASYEPGMYFVQTGDNGVFKVIKK